MSEDSDLVTVSEKLCLVSIEEVIGDDSGKRKDDKSEGQGGGSSSSQWMQSDEELARMLQVMWCSKDGVFV